MFILYMTRQSCSHGSVCRCAASKYSVQPCCSSPESVFYCSNRAFQGPQATSRGSSLRLWWLESASLHEVADECVYVCVWGNLECEGHLCGKSSEVNWWELPLQLAVVGDIEVQAAIWSLAFICCLFPATGHPLLGELLSLIIPLSYFLLMILRPMKGFDAPRLSPTPPAAAFTVPKPTEPCQPFQSFKWLFLLRLVICNKITVSVSLAARWLSADSLNPSNCYCFVAGEMVWHIQGPRQEAIFCFSFVLK